MKIFLLLLALSLQDGGEGTRERVANSMGTVGDWGGVPVSVMGFE
jgi:hypothetical protein